MKGITATGERKDIVDTLLKKTNLWDVRKKALSGSSGGMKQRFGIAQAPLGNPRIIIVDEPTAGSILPGVTTFSTCSVPSAATPSSSFLPISSMTFVSSARAWPSLLAANCSRVARLGPRNGLYFQGGPLGHQFPVGCLLLLACLQLRGGRRHL
jgi:hypothetical protein